MRLYVCLSRWWTVSTLCPHCVHTVCPIEIFSNSSNSAAMKIKFTIVILKFQKPIRLIDSGHSYIP